MILGKSREFKGSYGHYRFEDMDINTVFRYVLEFE